MERDSSPFWGGEYVDRLDSHRCKRVERKGLLHRARGEQSSEI